MKAQWKQNSNFEELNFSDTTYTFAKLNEENNKLFVYYNNSQKFEIWDLVEGKLITERKMPCKVDLIEYNFKSDIVYFYIEKIDQKDTILPKVNYTACWQLHSNDYISSIDLNLKLNPYLKNLFSTYPFKIIGNNLYIGFSVTTSQCPGGDCRNALFFELNMNTNNSTLMNTNGAIGESKLFENGFALFFHEWYLHLSGKTWEIRYPKTKLFVNGEGGNITKRLDNYTMYKDNDNMAIIDIYDGLLVLTSNYDTLKYVSLKDGNQINYTVNYPGVQYWSQIRNYKTIYSLRYSAYFHQPNIIKFYDYETKSILDSMNFKEGSLYYDMRLNRIYSLTKNSICRLKLKDMFIQSSVQNDETETSYNFEKYITITPYGLVIQTNEEIQVNMYNQIGMLIFSKKIHNNFEYNEYLPQGVYFINIIKGDKVINEKFIIE